MREPTPPPARPAPPDQPDRASLRRRIDELEDALAARDELLGIIGHELRNPLSPVFLQASHLVSEVRKNQSGSVATGWLQPKLLTLLGSLERLLDRLDRLTDASALQSGALSLVLEQVDLTHVVRDLCAGLEREAEAAGCAITVVMPERLVGRWDRVRVEQIAGNLISNAVRYGAGGPIEVRLWAGEKHAFLSVRDHGQGIAPDDQRRIFNRFEQVGPRPRGGGLGLGLWIAKRLCDAMGGELDVESKAGEGATFRVALPRRYSESND